MLGGVVIKQGKNRGHVGLDGGGNCHTVLCRVAREGFIEKVILELCPRGSERFMDLTGRIPVRGTPKGNGLRWTHA